MSDLISFPPCPECGGLGKKMSNHMKAACWDGCVCEAKYGPCPTCGGSGVEISDELRERVAKAIKPYIEVDTAIDDNWDLAQTYNARITAGIGLAVVVAHLRDGTKGTE